MTKRILAVILIAWFAGFLWFALALPGPLAKGSATVVVVPTGAAGRIDRGLEIIEEGAVETMLVTGVDPEVTPGEFAAQFDVPMDTMECCVILGFRAMDTRGNAAETADWVESTDVDSIRLVTTDWHMRRAELELRRTLPKTVEIEKDAVVSEPSLRIVFLEYHKLLAAYVYNLLRG